MRTVETVFFWVNWVACTLTAYAFWKEYRKLSKGKCGCSTGVDACEFVVHCLLALWWLIGTVVLGLLGINPFWILAWAFIGLVVSVVLWRLAEVGGLLTFVQAGEIYLKAIAQEQAAEFDRMVHEQQD